jgi:hypothetical protein
MRRVLITTLAAVGVLLGTASAASAGPAPDRSQGQEMCVWSDFQFSGQESCGSNTFTPSSRQIRSFANYTPYYWSFWTDTGVCWSYGPYDTQEAVDFGPFKFVRVQLGGCN